MFNFLKKNIGIILFIVGALFLIVFKLVGGNVGNDGILHEPFFLIPTGEFLLVLGGILMIVSYLRNGKI